MHVSSYQKPLFKAITFIFVNIILTSCDPYGKGSDLGNKAPVLSWDIINYNFGDVGVGSTTNAIFSLTNNGQIKAISCGAVNLSDITNFSIVSNTCVGSTMEIDQHCQVEIASHPTTPGQKSLVISRGCADGVVIQSGESQIVATGVVPTLLWSPLTNNFGNINVGANSAPLAFTMTNSGTAEASGCGQPSLTDSTNFSITANTCGTAALAISSSCLVSVRANPTTAGNKSTTLSRACTFGGTSTTTANEIRVTAIGLPVLAWSPLTKSFGVINIGDSSSAQTFTLTNSGSGAATGCGLPAIGDSTNFSIISDTCGTADLALSSSCNIQVLAQPQTVGSFSTTISRTCSSGGTTSTTTNQITATGLSPAVLAWSPLTYNYGDIQVGNVDYAFFTLNSSGSVAATGCSIPVLSNTTDFLIDWDTCDVNDLNSGDFCDIEVTSQPQSLGSKSTTVSRTCTVGGVATTTANQIVVNGVAPAPLLSISPNTYNFGNVNVGATSETQYFSISNTGLQPATGCSAPVLTDTTHFAIITDNCGTSNMTSYSSCTVGVASRPQSIGNFSTTLSRTCTVGGTASTLSQQITAAGAVAPDWKQAFALTSFSLVRSTTSSAPLSYYFRNPSSLPLTNCSLASIDNTTDFSIVSNDCTAGNMSAASLCEVQIRASPMTVGNKSAVLSRTCNESGSVTLNLSAVSTNAAVVATQIAMGVNSGCSLLSDQTVKCWGINSFGQLGDGTNQTRLTPVLVSGLTGVTQVSVGSDHTCALLSNGEVKCWGNNYSGQLGNSTNTYSLVPVNVTGISNAIGISASLSNACALLADNTIKCWGYNANGKLGNGTTVDSNSPVLVTGINNATQIITGQMHTCSQLADQTVKCWGANSWGQLGDNNPTPFQSSPVTVLNLTNSNQVVVGYNYTCSRLGDATVKCWGSNSNGQLGDGTLTDRLAPTLVSGISTAVQISSGPSHTCARLSNQTVKCWGSNWYGELGDDTLNISSTPVVATGINNATQISLGQNITCSILSNNSVKCWGYNNEGQLGRGRRSILNAVKVVPGITTAVQVSSSYGSTCVLLSDGTVQCAGSNNIGLLGDGTTISRKNFSAVSGISNATQIIISGAHACALINDGTIKCWGYNYYGQLGDGTLISRTTPVFVTGISNAVQISISQEISCARLSDGTVKCWGNNSQGQLGNGTTTNSAVPVLVSGISTAVDVAINFIHGCANLSNGTVKCWGYNSSGQLGDGTTTNSLTAVSVLGITTATKVISGVSYSCALLSNQTVKCWGNNYTGQLGDGTTATRLAPVLVQGIQNATQISAVGESMCALLADQKVKCWGNNYYGQLGDGTFITRSLPVYSLNMNSIVSLSLSNLSFNRCNVKSDGTVLCVGTNESSQNGFDETTKVDISGL